MLTKLKNPNFQLIIIIIITAITWSSSLHHNFCGYDDIRLVMGSEALAENLKSGFATFWQNYSYSFNSIWSNKLTVIFRPLEQYASLAAYKIWGAQPLLYHLFFNFLTHIANAILLFLITNRFIKTKALAFLIVLIWAVHPLHNEAINMISSGTGFLLGHFFSLSGAYLLLRENKSSSWWQNLNYILGAIFIFVGFLGSEMTLITPIIVVIILAYSKTQAQLRKSLLAIAALLSYIYLRIDILLASQASSNSDLIERTFVLAPQIFLHHVKQFFLPLQLSIDEQHQIYLSNAHSLYHYLSLLISIAFVLALIYAIYYKRQKIALALLITALYIGPCLNIKELYCLARERYTYIFVFGLILALALLLRKPFRKLNQRTRIILISCLVIGLGARSFTRNLDWINGEKLFGQVIAQNEDIGVKQHWTYKLLKYQRDNQAVDQDLLNEFSSFIAKHKLNDINTVNEFKEIRTETYIKDKYSQNRAKAIASALHYTANYNKKTFSQAEYLKHIQLAYIYDQEHFFNTLELFIYLNDIKKLEELIKILDRQSTKNFPKANKFLQAIKTKKEWKLLETFAEKYSRLYPTVKYFHEYKYLAAIRLKNYDKAYQEAKFLNTKYYYRELIQEFIDQYEAGKYQNHA